jgi:DNA-binding GntR family transcriptional regulator
LRSVGRAIVHDYLGWTGAKVSPPTLALIAKSWRRSAYAYQGRKAKLGSPDAFERTTLKLAAGDQVVRFDRMRTHAEPPFAYEIISLRAALSRPALRNAPPAEIEELAQFCGVLVARAEGKVRATVAPPAAAAALGLASRPSYLCWSPSSLTPMIAPSH